MSFIVDGRFAYGKYAGFKTDDVQDRDYIAWVIASKEQLALTIDELSMCTPALEGIVEDTVAAPGLFALVITSSPKITWTDEQTCALDQIEDWKSERYDWADGTGRSFISLTGPAGTGKSSLVREIVARYPSVQLTAMTGKAALRLADCAGRGAKTLHSVLYFPPKPGEDTRFTRLRPPESQFVVVDESSMMGGNVFADCQKWAEQGVRFLLVGDSYQLPPVITGEEAKKYGDDYSVFTQVGGAALQTVMRSAGGVLLAAQRVRDTGEICEESMHVGDGIYNFVRERSPMQRAVHDYLSDRDGHMLITWKNSTRMQANNAIRSLLGHDGPLPDVGEPVLIKKNGQGYMNGEVVTCAGFEDGPTIGSLKTLWMSILNGPRVLVSVDGGDREKGGEFFDGQLPWIKDWRSYHIDMRKNLYPEPLPVTWAYCLTAHSGQGGEARRVTVFLNRDDLRNKYFRKPTTLPNGNTVEFSARFVYTALTRGRKHSTMIVGE